MPLLGLPARASDGVVALRRLRDGDAEAYAAAFVADPELGRLLGVECDPDVSFFFREEVGHDLVGYPPPTIELARRQLASTRRTTATAAGAVSAEVLARVVEIPDLGTMTIEEWSPLILGHAAGHVEQAFEIMRSGQSGKVVLDWAA